MKKMMLFLSLLSVVTLNVSCKDSYEEALEQWQNQINAQREIEQSYETCRSSDDAAPYEDGPTIFEVIHAKIYPESKQPVTYSVANAIEASKDAVACVVQSVHNQACKVVDVQPPVKKKQSFVSDHAYEIGGGAIVVAALTYWAYQNGYFDWMFEKK